MRDLKPEELGHVYGADGTGRTVEATKVKDTKAKAASASTTGYKTGDFTT